MVPKKLREREDLGPKIYCTRLCPQMSNCSDQFTSLNTKNNWGIFQIYMITFAFGSGRLMSILWKGYSTSKSFQSLIAFAFFISSIKKKDLLFDQGKPLPIYLCNTKNKSHNLNTIILHNNIF